MTNRNRTSPAQDSLVGFIHLLDRNQFNVGLDIVRGAEVEHLLGFTDAPDHRASDAASMQNQRKWLQRRRFVRSPHENMVPSVLRRFT